MAQIPRDALGLGLRPALYPYLFEHWPKVDYFEIISENFMGPAELPQKNLSKVLRRYPIVLHGVGLNLLGHEPLDACYLDQLAALAERVDAPFVSDHLCWTGAHGLRHHDLLPTPYLKELVDYAAMRAAAVQQHLGRPFALENLSSYLAFEDSEMPEWEFYAAVVNKANCWFMLDINNIYVSSQNHGFNPLDYLAAINFSKVIQVHLAGHERQPDGTIIDTHDQAVCDAVWELYRSAWKMGGPFPTLLEWDDRIPSMPDLIAELEKARRIRLS